MHRLKEHLPSNILQMIYNSLVLPHLNYGVLLWGHKNSRIALLQKKCVRIIKHSKFNAHTEPIFKELNLLKMNDIFLHQQLKFYFKYINNQLPDYFKSFNIKLASEVHNYNTRNRNATFTERTNLVNTEKCLRHAIIKTINDTPAKLINKVDTHSKHGFAMYAKNYYISNYVATCSIPDCYICNAPNS